jgi:hypothetical protein
MSFLPAMFSPSATNVNVRRINEDQLNQEFDGLALATVLMQTGGAFPLHEFRSVASATEPTPVTPVPPPGNGIEFL